MTATGQLERPPAAAREAQPSPAWDGAAIVVPAVVAAILSLVGITGRSLGFDEAATVTIASQHGSALGSAIAHDGGNMSGYYLLLHVLIAAFGNGLLAIRLPSAVAVVATVALVGVLGRQCFGRAAAFAAGLLSAVSLPLIFWAQNARGYAAMVAFVCAAFVVFISLCQSHPPRISRPPAQRGRRWLWIAYVVLMALAIYSSFVAVLVVPVQLIVLARRREILGRFVLSLVALALCGAPLVVLALSRGSSQLFWVPRPTSMLETQVLQSLTSAGLQPSFRAGAITTPLLVLTLVLLAAIAAVIGADARPDGRRRNLRHEAPDQTWAGILMLAWLAVPVLLTWVSSYLIQPTFVPRNLLMSVPPVALLLGRGLAGRRLPRVLAGAVLVGLVALRAVALAGSYGVSPEPWQQSTAYVLARARPHDCVAFYPADGRMAFQYYVGGDADHTRRAPRSVLPIVRWGVVRPFVEQYVDLSPVQLAGRTAGCGRMWFVTSHEGQADGPARSRENRARFLKLRSELERAFGGTAPIAQFGYAAAIHVQLMAGGQGRSAGAGEGVSTAHSGTTGAQPPSDQRVQPTGLPAASG